MNKYLITGGAGFIGSHAARHLLSRGEKVVILDDFNDRYDPRLKEARVEHFFTDALPPLVIKADIRELSQLQLLFKQHKFDYVIHLAAWASVPTSIDRPHIYTSVNVDGTVNILETARQHNIKNLVFASSSSVYGGRQDVPFKETDHVNLPISPYAATKVAGEVMCAAWNHLYNLPISCLRFFTVYGPWGRPEMAIFKFAEAILRNQPIQMRGRVTERDFTYIDDCVAGIIAAIDRPLGYRIFNLGESDSVPLPRFIAALESALGKPAIIEEVPLPPGDVPRTLADITQAQKLLGYHPSTSIEQGIPKFIDWYRKFYLPNFIPNLSKD